MYLLALKLGMVRGTIDPARAEKLLAEVRSLPELAQRTLDRGDLIEPVADRFWQNEFFLYLGRYIGLPDRAGGRAQAQGDQLHPDRRATPPAR